MPTEESDGSSGKLRIYGFNGQRSKHRSLVEQGEMEPHNNSEGLLRLSANRTLPYLCWFLVTII